MKWLGSRLLPLPFVFAIFLPACASQGGGQTGSEIGCEIDADCFDELGQGYRCGENGTCEETPVGEPFFCRERDDCDDPLHTCNTGLPQGVCGIPPQEDCATDAQCSESLVCHSMSDPCSPDGVGSNCRKSCTATSCEPGFRCNEGGACEPIPCNEEGYSCAAHLRCVPPEITEVMYDKSHGCQVIACEADDVCNEGSLCVNGRCQEDLGICKEPEDLPPSA